MWEAPTVQTIGSVNPKGSRTNNNYNSIVTLYLVFVKCISSIYRYFTVEFLQGKETLLIRHHISHAGMYQFFLSIGIRSEARHTTAPVPIAVFKWAVPEKLSSSDGSASIGDSTEKFLIASFGALPFFISIGYTVPS